MLESKDPAIKLFGMKIPFPTVLELADEEEDKVTYYVLLHTSIKKISFGVLKSVCLNFCSFFPLKAKLKGFLYPFIVINS